MPAASPSSRAVVAVIAALDGVRPRWERTLHHVLADAMAAVTLLLVALLKNAERRAEHAVQGKLDRLAEAMLATPSWVTLARERGL